MTLARRRGGFGLVLVAAIILFGIAVARLNATGAMPSNGTGAGAGDAASSPSMPAPSGDVTDDSHRVATVDELPSDTRAEFDSLPSGTVLVACTGAVAKLPDGIIPNVSPGWLEMHPAWRVLAHGYCVDNPNAMASLDPQVIDAP